MSLIRFGKLCQAKNFLNDPRICQAARAVY